MQSSLQEQCDIVTHTYNLTQHDYRYLSWLFLYTLDMLFFNRTVMDPNKWLLLKPINNQTHFQTCTALLNSLNHDLAEMHDRANIWPLICHFPITKSACCHVVPGCEQHKTFTVSKYASNLLLPAHTVQIAPSPKSHGLKPEVWICLRCLDYQLLHAKCNVMQNKLLK